MRVNIFVKGGRIHLKLINVFQMVSTTKLQNVHVKEHSAVTV